MVLETETVKGEENQKATRQGKKEREENLFGKKFREKKR